jgi:hypothetical protein
MRLTVKVDYGEDLVSLPLTAYIGIMLLLFSIFYLQISSQYHTWNTLDEQLFYRLSLLSPFLTAI